MSGIKDFPERLPASKENMKSIKVIAAGSGRKIYEVGDELLTQAIEGNLAKFRKSLKDSKRMPKGKVITSRSKIRRE